MRRLLISVTMILSGWVRLEGQQDATLFFMHSTPQANFVNPAVRNDCKWMLGLPVLSSFHVEYGNSGFSVMQLIHNLPDSTIQSLNLNPINYITTELYINLFFL